MLLTFVLPRAAVAQIVTNRGFVDAAVLALPQRAPNDATRLVGDLLIRGEVFVKPAPWAQFAAGLDFCANSHDQIADGWRLDVSDRGVRRPRLSVRRLTATLTHHGLTIDVGRQFVRWGKTDIVTPTDRFAPRDFLNVVDARFLAVTGARAVAELGSETFDVVWVPRLTPSRVPLVDQRWTTLPADAGSLPIVDRGKGLPSGTETGLRWSHAGSPFEYSLSFFDGFNHLPNIEADVRAGSQVTPFPLEIDVIRDYPAIRMYGADLAAPASLFTLRGEAAYFTSSSSSTDQYVLYVVQLERQKGEWTLVGGYAGEVVTSRRATRTFAPDRGMANSVVGRASYTIDSNRGLAFEAAVRQSGRGIYAKAEYSQARGQHWRATVTSVALTGHSGDFLGQYHRNSHVAAALRYSF